MATYSWSIPSGNTITGSTIIKDTDNKIQATINDLVDFVNAEGVHSNQGLTFDMVDKTSAQVISGVKTFQNGITSDVIGDVTGDVTGNSDTSTALATSRTIAVTGDITGSASFDGSTNISIATTIDTPIFITGMIMMWSGSSADVPSGWLLCDGTNSTPNLIGRFIRGAASSGESGGSADAALVSHTHAFTATADTVSLVGNINGGYVSGNSYGSSSGIASQANITVDGDGGESRRGRNITIDASHSHSISGTISSSGDSATDKNLPPYYELCYIIKG